jgi:hypothetical protein
MSEKCFLFTISFFLHSIVIFMLLVRGNSCTPDKHFILLFLRVLAAPDTKRSVFRTANDSYSKLVHLHKTLLRCNQNLGGINNRENKHAWEKRNYLASCLSGWCIMRALYVYLPRLMDQDLLA